MQNKIIIRKKILIIGAFAVGKTSLVTKYTTGTFSEEYLSTIGVNIKNKTIEYDDKIVHLIIWDIADIVTYQNIPNSYIKGSHGLMLVYDLTRKETYQRICDEYKGFLNTSPNLKKIVVGNKSDLFEHGTNHSNGDLAEITDITTSAKHGINVDQAFQLLVNRFITEPSYPSK